MELKQWCTELLRRSNFNIEQLAIFPSSPELVAGSVGQKFSIGVTFGRSSLPRCQFSHTAPAGIGTWNPANFLQDVELVLLY